ncbi:hypothetical protein FE257_004930 [Aspergillus nanangensis]|uniref:RING-type domain-containing protein n=1 Tax=Aspergillus nanangensis TaxID=2582783 RepID=A0AAD4CBM0_ASPNN|nr:hypothetical protein FE257_004930 [Aspergillus nanangensis]
MSAETQDRIIASSLLLEAFPPNTHEFHPNNIFRERYRSPCLHALQQVFGPIDTGARSHSIESSFVSCYAHAVGRESSPLDVHAHNLAQFQSIFQHLYSNHSCLGCLVSSPQNSLPCGHTLCDACVQRYGQPKPRAESVYFFEECPLYQRPGLISIAILPSTAAVRALTVNRGGVRVVISLQILLELQDILGPRCSLSDLIDIAWGTSADNNRLNISNTQTFEYPSHTGQVLSLSWTFLFYENLFSSVSIPSSTSCGVSLANSSMGCCSPDDAARCALSAAGISTI